ncbi:class I SAM-dependent DNA methyltransferase [Palleronia pelagia]|uniref:Methyltransferase domain-containing protein n=1 Tax=Palleronia pelagia TaxID=387096 RepID=A0A1H8DIN3_9RHOB|nr:class I SAM-dependent methyltransferase [Palleronia pelagia]SEN07202.1 Methyltransferase domain-containing protein [Palleronia pelagia]
MASEKSERAQSFDLRNGSTDVHAVSGYYDDWAATYDDTLKAWNYQAPSVAAERLAVHLTPGDAVLDVGCGTGLFGQAMARQGAFRMTGLDISAESLRRAGDLDLYERLVAHDLQRLPLPVEGNAVAAAACIGVLTYIEDAADLLRDMCRCTRPGGVVTFTQRTDRWAERDFAKAIEAIATEGIWTVLEISEPMDYLPGNDDFGKEIKVIHTLCRVS